jgi:hypothetical protein
MEKKPDQTQTLLDQLQQRISELERRVASLEFEGASREPRSYIRISSGPDGSDEPVRKTADGLGESVESRIGEYGMAWLGNIVLLFGVLFLTQFLRAREQELLSVTIGLGSVVAIYLSGFYTRKSLPYLSRLFGFNGHILLFMIAMQVYLLPGNRLTENVLLGEGIVFLVIASMLYLAFRRTSQVLAIIGWIMAVVAAISSNSTHLILALMTGVAWSALFFTVRFNWWTGLITSIILVYFTFLVWILGDPFVTHDAGIISTHQYSHLYLFAIAAAYTLLSLLPRSDRFKERILNAAILLNGLGFSTLLVIMVLAFFAENYFLLFGVIAACCMGFSIWLKFRGRWEKISGLYAIYGFIALSICIAGAFHFPRAFLLLSIQSLLVVSLALWFRSRFIVIMNTLLFVGLLITYLALPDNLHSINFTFALIALVTARILNWKKKLLEIRTELIRNIFLLTGSGMLFFSLQQAVPVHLVSLSWVAAAVAFFLLSLLLHNIKYRWLAIASMVVTVFYVFIVDLKSISLGYRVVALMVISVISLGISIFYSRRLREKSNDPAEPDSAG